MLLRLLFLFLLFLHIDGSPLEVECESLGFISSELSCDTCQSLFLHTQDDSLHTQCKKCCTETSIDDDSYQSARLEYSPFSIERYPHIHQFIGKHADEFAPALQLVQKRNQQRPVLIGVKVGGQEKEMIVTAWKTEHFIEFLKEKLRPVY